MQNLVYTAANHAMASSLIQIESSFGRGFSGLQLIGNASEICRDGKERAKSALESIGITIPAKKIITSLTPAEVKKDGSQFDLPLAISIGELIKGIPKRTDFKPWVYAAELSLNGSLKPVRGVISFAITALAHNLAGIIVAKQNLHELVALEHLSKEHQSFEILGFEHLAEVFKWLEAGSSGASWTISSYKKSHPVSPELITKSKSFDDMVLTEEQKLAALCTATGEHNLLLRGTPGSGKSMFSYRVASLLPNLEKDVHTETLKIHSSYNQNIESSLLSAMPPFRAPHHQSSTSAILGSTSKPGEISMAHGGILFLDEFPEFRRDLIEALREPLETGFVRISRTKANLGWKAKCILLAAANNCPCGWFGSKRKKCRCNITRIKAYTQKLSGPILDRIDIHINMPEPAQSGSKLLFSCQATPDHRQQQSIDLIEKVKQARAFGSERNRQLSARVNSDIESKHIITACKVSSLQLEQILKSRSNINLTNRSLLKMLRVARSLADLESCEAVKAEHLIQALSWQSESAAEQRGDIALGLY